MLGLFKRKPNKQSLWMKLFLTLIKLKLGSEYSSVRKSLIEIRKESREVRLDDLMKAVEELKTLFDDAQSQILSDEVDPDVLSHSFMNAFPPILRQQLKVPAPAQKAELQATFAI